MLLLLAACDSSSVLTLDTEPSGTDEAPVEDAGGTTDTGDPPDREEPDFFDDSFIHEVDIHLSAEARTGLRRDPYTYVEGSVTVDGNAFDRVAIRLRGKYGSFRRLGQKPKFKLDFNRYVPDQRLGPYETLALNNEVVDCSYLREPTGYAVFRQLGLPAPRTAFTHVTVDDEDYGLYVGLEFPDDTFLEAHYDDPSGNLYDGKYLYWPDSGNYALVDFTPDLVDNFTLEEGEDVGRSDVHAIADAVQASGSFADRLGPLVDSEEFHRHTVAEQWIGHVDGYVTNVNNYRIYFDPTSGRAQWLTYDLDYAFYSASSWGMDWNSPNGAVAAACWTDADCRAAHVAAVGSALQTIDTDTLLAQIDAWSALIADSAEADPKRECSASQIPGDQAVVRNWIAGAPDGIAGFWGVALR
jgi:spore coat protein CotH